MRTCSGGVWTGGVCNPFWAFEKYGLRSGCSGFSTFSAEELICELLVGCRAEAGGFILHDGFSVGRGFAESDGPGDDGSVDDVLKMRLDLGDDGLREVIPHEHGQQDAGDTESGIGLAFSDLSDDTIDFGQSFEGEVLALDRNEEFVGGSERIGHENAKGGGAIEKHVVEGGRLSQGFEGDTESGEVFAFAGYFDFCAGEVDIAGDEPEVFSAGGDDAVLEVSVSEEGFVDAEAFDGVVAERAGCVCLRVEVDEEDAVASGGDGRGEVDGGGRFSDASLLVSHCDDFHSVGSVEGSAGLKSGVSGLGLCSWWGMHSLDEALALVRGATDVLEAERITLERALGRVLREELRSEADSPVMDVSAMDGYALGPMVEAGVWRVLRTARAGEEVGLVIGAGEAIRVFTGGGVPKGAERVLPQEDAVLGEDGCVREGGWGGVSFIRRQGENVRVGEILMGAGTRFGPGDLAVAGLSGVGEVFVTREVSVFHVTTGDELVGVGEAMRPGGVRDTNALLVRGALERWVGGGFRQARVRDDEKALTELVAAAVERGVDLVLVSGGAGAGAFDFGWKALERNGFDLVFRGVAMKPGKPVIYARRGRTSAFVLPGNPLSHFVVLQTLVAEWLRMASGESRSQGWVRLPLAAALNAGRDAREILWPGRICCTGGRMAVEAGVWQSSGDVTGLGGVDVLIRIPAGTGDLAAGSEVTCLMARLI